MHVEREGGRKETLSLCSIIIVAHNNLKYTQQCIESIIKNTDYHPFELIVVDAKSSDGTLEYLSSKPEVKIVHLDKNYPFSYSVNRGIQKAKGEYLCFLNNDTIIVQPNWLRTLIGCIKADSTIGIVGPRLCEPKFVDDAGRCVTPDRTQLPRYIMPDGNNFNICPSDNTITPCTYVIGACFLSSRRLLDEVGPFDEGFFFSYDETDYCVRTWKAGKKVVCNTWTAVVHLGNKTIEAVTDKDYEYDIKKYEDPVKRFHEKHSSKDLESILRQIRGPMLFHLLMIRHKIHKIGQGIDIIRKSGLKVFLEKTSAYLKKNKHFEKEVIIAAM